MYTKHKWESDRYFNFGYVQYLPKDYDENKKYPLVFFLHGAGERGEDLDWAGIRGYMRYVKFNVGNVVISAERISQIVCHNNSSVFS